MSAADSGPRWIVMHVRRCGHWNGNCSEKEKAPAETAALLTLSKKARAIWGEGEDA